MINLADFLLARIAEEEEVARAGADQTYPGFGSWVLHNQVRHAFGTPSPVIASRARVLAECEAKRRLVDGYLHLVSDPELRMQAWTFALRCLALPYADHPDYREEWRP